MDSKHILSLKIFANLQPNNFDSNIIKTIIQQLVCVDYPVQEVDTLLFKGLSLK